MNEAQFLSKEWNELLVWIASNDLRLSLTVLDQVQLSLEVKFNSGIIIVIKNSPEVEFVVTLNGFILTEAYKSETIIHLIKRNMK